VTNASSIGRIQHAKRRNAEKRLVPYRNTTEQLETELSRKMYGDLNRILQELKRIPQMLIFCFKLFEIKATRFDFFL